jgi:Rrf2 family protein
MKMSTKGRYGLRVMMELAGHYGRGPMPVDAIAKNQDISGKYIHLLVVGLRSAGLVRAIRGPGGGYELTRNPSSITALDVISALEGRSAPVDCVADASACPRADRCAARDMWCDVASAVDGVMSGLTLTQLSARQHAKENEPRATASRKGAGWPRSSKRRRRTE